MLIKKVEIHNILGVESVNLVFSNNSPTYVVQRTRNGATRSTFSTAIELIFSAKYAKMESLDNLKDLQNGFVRITFLVPRKSAPALNTEEHLDEGPSTSKKRRLAARNQNNAHQIEIVACRDFRFNIADIIYSIDGAPKKRCSPTAFHGKFSTNAHFVFPYLEKMHEITQSGNFLRFIVEQIHYNWFQDQQALNHLPRSFQKDNSEQNTFLSKHTTYFLNTILVNNVVLRLNILKVCGDIRTIFEYITCQEYTVWFFIPCQGKYIDMSNMVSEDFDFDAIETCIQLKNYNKPSLIAWTDCDKSIRDMLLITLDLAVAVYCKTSLIFIDQTDAINEYQAMKLSTTAYLQKFKEAETTNWIRRNYLQRIIDVCNIIKVAVVIEHTGMHIPLINANIIKCLSESPHMTICNSESYNIDSFIERVKANLL